MITDFPRTGKDAQPDSPIGQILQNGVGIAQALDAAPTTANNMLPRHMDNGFYSGNWYINFFGTVYKVSLTAV